MQKTRVLAGGFAARFALAASAIEGDVVVGAASAIGAGSGDVRPMGGGVLAAPGV